MVADLYDPNEQQYAVAFIVFSSVFGSVIGPLVGPFIQANLSWYVDLHILLLPAPADFLGNGSAGLN
jgi:MFS family permease